MEVDFLLDGDTEKLISVGITILPENLQEGVSFVTPFAQLQEEYGKQASELSSICVWIAPDDTAVYSASTTLRLGTLEAENWLESTQTD